MKRLLIVPSLLLMISTAGFAQGPRLDSAPRSFRIFFATFQRAVERSDKTAVAAMTSFPFEYGFDAGDEGQMTRRQFVKRFNDVFGADPRDFITERNPLFSYGEGGSYVISTENAAHLTFVRSGRTYKFLDYIVEP